MAEAIEMEEKTMKEFEALSVVRDILVILYSEIGENIGEEPKHLFEAYCCVNSLVEKMEEEMDPQTD